MTLVVAQNLGLARVKIKLQDYARRSMFQVVTAQPE